MKLMHLNNTFYTLDLNQLKQEIHFTSHEDFVVIIEFCMLLRKGLSFTSKNFLHRQFHHCWLWR
jgi:hypothetical protein